MRILKNVIKNMLKCGIPVNCLTRPFFSALYLVHVGIREGGIWALRLFYYEPLFRSQCRAVGKGLWMEELPYIVNSGAIYLGENVRLSGKPSFSFSSRLYPDPSLTIGDNTFIGHQASFSIGKTIVIGNDCLLAGGVHIADNDGHPLDYRDRMNHLPPRKEDVREVRVGNNVWIGSQAVILKGVTIGDRAVVGARAVVTKDVPPDVVVAGNPARVVKRLGGGEGGATS
jgi:acetyltransferase-like isoleucine patch superfamily enzyme